jgi:hypothetical protein
MLPTQTVHTTIISTNILGRRVVLSDTSEFKSARSTQNPLVSLVDGKMTAVRFEGYGTAEHEWGIAPIQKAFNIDRNGRVRKVPYGLELFKRDNYMFLIYYPRKWYQASWLQQVPDAKTALEWLDAWDEEPSSDTLPAYHTAWSKDSFGIGTRTDVGKQFLGHVYARIRTKQATIHCMQTPGFRKVLVLTA